MRACEFLPESLYYSNDAKKYQRVKSYFDSLIKQNIERLGKGQFSQVFQHPLYSNVVVKIFYADSGYENYLKFILTNPQNRYVPQIIPAKNKKLVHSAAMRAPASSNFLQDWRFVFMKKYSPANLQQIYDLFQRWNTLSGDSEFPPMTNPKDLRLLVSKLVNWVEWSDSNELRKNDPDAWAMANFIVKNWKSQDLHSGNFMWDSENQTVVFTDPLVG